MAPQRRNVLISVIVLTAFVFGTMGFAVSAQAISPIPSVSVQYASIARAIQSLLHLLEVAKIKAISSSPYLAQVTGGTTCPSGYHSMSDTSGNYCMSDTSSTTCQPAGGGAIYTCPTGTTTTSPSPSPSPSSTTTSSCTASLIALLGDGCHWMYTDTYCDGPMTKSAKSGDTVTTPGCSGSTTTTTTTTGTGGLYPTQSGADIILTWTDFYTGENEYRIERKITGGTWTQIGTTAFLAGGTGTYRDTAVPSGSYEYHVKPCTSSGCFGESNTAYATAGGSTTTTTTTTTTSTTGALTTTISGSDVVLNWTDFYTGENEYRIERRIGSTGTWAQVGTITYLAGGTGTYRDTAVPSGSYEYHVKPCTSSGCFGESNTAYATVGGSSTSTVAPTTATAAPVIGNIIVSNITTNSATIGWTTDIPANSKIEYGISTPNTTLSDGSFVTNHTMYVSGLSASTTYTYNVISENQDYYRTTFFNKTFSTLSSGGTTNTTTTTSSCTASLIALLGDGCHWMYTDTYCDGPMTKSAKSGDTVTTPGCSGSTTTTTTTTGTGGLYPTQSGADIILTWTDFYTGENEYRIERKITGGTWTQIGTTAFLAGGTGTYRDTAVPSGSYEYHVKPCTSSGCFGESNTAYATAGGSTTTTTTNTSCSSSLITLLGNGCHQMYTDSTGATIYCDGAMTKSAKSTDTVTTPGCSYSGTTTTTNTTTTSCTASLIALLGDGCHWMYTDTYCDGPMTKSAKSGDTVAMSGCSSSPGGTPLYQSGCSVNTSQSSCTVNTSCSWISGSTFNYCDTKSSYAGDSNSCPGFSYSRWDTGGRRYCQMNQVKVCQYTYPDYLDIAKYTTASCPTQEGEHVATSTQSGIPATPGGLRAALQSNGDVNLFWNDYAVNENEYRVEWKNLSGSWIVIGTAPIVYGGNGSYIDRPSSGRTHEYRVRACNTAGCSGESNFATVTIGGASKIPVITSLSLRAGPIGTRVTITGTGFTTVGNRINFGAGVLMDIPSPDGMTLVFTIPEDQVPLCAVTEPRCLLPAPYNPVKLGGYQVSVTTMDATSAWFSFSVTEREASVFAVDLSGTYPKSGQTVVETSARIRVKLTREFDSRSMVQEFFRLIKDATPTIRVNGTFTITHDGFEFIPSQELESNASYTYSLFATLKDRNGMSLLPFTASFTTGSGAGRLSGTINGKVNDSDGKAVARATVYLFSYQNSFWRTVETDASGSFQAVLPGGNYFIEVHPPFDNVDLGRANPREIKILSGETQNIALVLNKTIKVITGIVSFSNGSAVTDAEVSAYASETKQWKNIAVDANGSYKLKVGGGVWFVGLHPRDADQAAWLWNEPPRRVVFSNDQNGETKTVDFVVPVSNTTVTVTTVDDVGAPLSNTGVVIDSGRFIQSQSLSSSFFGFVPPEFRVTDSSGKAVFTLRAGAYYVRAYLSSDRGYFNPAEQQVTLSGGDAKEIKMVFRKKQQTRASMIRGVTILEQGIPVDAFVWAWSERGGFVSTQSDENGVFSITVLPNDRWHVGAGKEYKEFGYKSTELIIDVKNEPVAVEIALIKQGTAPLPPTVNVTETAQSQVVAQVTDGAQMTLPPSAATSTNTVQLEINPTLEAPVQTGTKVMGTVYDVTVRDGGGKEITSLAKEAELIIPYSEEELKNQGVSEDAIVPSFFDEKTETWVTIDDYTIDKERNVIIARVTHLTRFAITAAADITPPSAPTTINTQVLGAGKIKITWKNPAKDFNYAKIYRSLKEKELGIVREAAIRGEQFVDEDGISENTAYYYTVRAVDPAGNESVNTAQTRIIAARTSGRAESVSMRPMGALSRTLRRGMKGEDVTLLQQALTADGVYAEEATGFFGKLTEAAVIRFQEKYAEAILKPAGLSRGSGVVGPGTRKKINSILTQ